MIIGILKEPEGENRVMLLPEHVEKLSNKSIEVLIELGASTNSFFSDKDYSNAGAKVVKRNEIFDKADIIGAITSIPKKDIDSIPEKKIIISVLNPLVDLDKVRYLQNRNLTSFSLDIIPRITRAQSMDILSSMATIAGYKAVLEAANNLPKFFPMFMSAAGTIRPAKVLILGAGVAGLQAVATARKLGAIVEVFDVRTAVKEEVKSLGAKFIEVEGAKEEAEAGGYAVEQTEDFQLKQQQAIHDHAIKANVIITTAQIPGKKAPILLKKETVDQMIPGSVIIDLASASGGNCELTKDNETIRYNRILIIGNSNYASSLPLDSSRMFGNNFLNFLAILVDENSNIKLDFNDEIISGTCLTHEGEIISEKVKSLIQ